MSQYALALQEDALSRSRALDFTSFIVEAPAGAGKTELLTQRFLKLLQVVDAPEEIIAITFTNKAAAEMRLRILDSLLKAAAGEVPTQPHKQQTHQLSLAALQKSQAQDWRLLENPARLRIFTIDGLCAYLARQMPLMSQFGAQPTITDDPDNHYAQAVERTLALIDDAENGATVIAALRYLDNDVNQLKKLLIRMLSMRDQWLHQSQKTITPEQLQNTLRVIVQEELTMIAKVISLPIQNALMPLARFAAGNVSCEQRMSLLRDWDTPLATHAESLPMWQAVADLLLTGKHELRKRITKDEGFPADEKAQKQTFTAFLESLASVSGAEQALARVRKLPAINQHAQSWQIISTLSTLLNLAAAQLWLVFSAAREVDFAEVAQRAAFALMDGLDTPTELALRLDYQIKHLLVDEFQDTSPSQINLLEKLTQGWQPQDGRTLFTVGDPMQSIYRFRKANVGLFLNAAQYGIGDVTLEKLRLSRNNRSCPPVIDWINQTFSEIFPKEDDTAKGAISYRPFIATRENTADTGVAIHPIIKLQDENTESIKQREAQAVIEIIVRERQVHPTRKIAILVRAKAHLQYIVTELRRHHKGLHFQAVEIEALANRQIVQDLLSLTRALHHRADRVSWLAILRAPWCGLTLHDLYALAGRDHHSTVWSLMQQSDSGLSEDGQQRLNHVCEIFSEAFTNQGRVNVSRWIRGVWLLLGGASCLWEESDVVDVQAFFDCIEALDRNNQFSPERLETEIAKLFAAPDSAGEYLQMMTIHKSKGLEFDTVILPGLGHGANGKNDDKPIVLWEEVSMPTTGNHPGHHQEIALLAAPLIPKGLRSQTDVSPYDYLSMLESERADNEDARILYVAATRAEKKLHLVGVANQNKEGDIKPLKNSYLALLWSVAKAHYLSADCSQAAAHAIESSLEKFIPKLVRLEKPSIPVMLQLNEKPTQFPTKISNQPIIEPNTIEADIGTLTHFYLERIAKQGVEKWSEKRINTLHQAMQYWFKQQGYVEKVAVDAAEHVQRLLINTLSSKQGCWVLASHEDANSELALSQVQVGDTKTYVVDRTFIETIDGKKTRWVIDYKTMSIEENIHPAALKLIAEQFRTQLEEYSQLFITEGLQIIKAIFFVSIGRLVLIEEVHSNSKR